MSGPLLLAIDTSTVGAGVALVDGEFPLAHLAWCTPNRQSSHLSAGISTVLEMAERPMSQISAVIVATGPGSFNGIRVGISEAKGLAFGLGVPLAGISTLDAIGLQAACAVGRVVALVEAGRGEVFSADYTGCGRTWRRASEYRRLPIHETARQCRSGDTLAGPASGLVAVAASGEGINLTCQPPAARIGRTGYLAELGRRYLEANGQDQLDSVEPLYLRRSAAEETRDAAGRRSK
ncbi:MAG TPA: tRNA (adenosine(37)-N6)-threonylcarbamoyltransferase complex dimerization subunit type 1 TsaB [Chloroflexota bacterium]|nr:tRNA (adenosine(37)-N6)-threonylcarbamoyltransferase complex dimerization subunit type 1 TsaB [Chloroflexota bacterium]